MKTEVTAFVEVYKNQPDLAVIGLTFYGQGRDVSGRFTISFDSMDHAIQHLLLDFEVMLTNFDCDDLEKGVSVRAPVNFESSEDFIEEVHFQFCEQDDVYLFNSYKMPIPTYEGIDLRGRDYLLARAPKDTVESIRQAVTESGRPDSFYLIAEEDDPFVPIKAVHFLTKDEMYIRKNGSWKVMNPVEWEQMDGTMDWQINPEFGVDFLKRFDQGGMELIDANPFVLPNPYLGDLKLPESDSHLSSESRHNDRSNVRSNYFECVIYDDEIHYHGLKNDSQIYSSDEISLFATRGGALVRSGRDWVFVLPEDTSVTTDDYLSDFERLVKRLPYLAPDNLSCGEWIHELNEIGRDRFVITMEPTTIGFGNFSQYLSNLLANRNMAENWIVLRGQGQ